MFTSSISHIISHCLARLLILFDVLVTVWYIANIWLFFPLKLPISFLPCLDSAATFGLEQYSVACFYFQDVVKLTLIYYKGLTSVSFPS